KSGLINLAAAHGALALDTQLVLLDGKQVELGMWRYVADAFVGPKITDAIALMRRLFDVMERRYAWLTARNRRGFTRRDGITVILTLIDELALFSATL